MALSYNLLLRTGATAAAVARTLLGSEPDPGAPDPYRGRLGDVEVSVHAGGPPRPGDPVVTELGVDYTVQVLFTADKWAPMAPQTAAVIAAAGAVRARLGGAGALLFERDVVILRWSDGSMVVNEASPYRDQALEVLGPMAAVEAIPWG